MQYISSRCSAAVHQGAPPRTFARHSYEYSSHALPKSVSTNTSEDYFKRIAHISHAIHLHTPAIDQTEQAFKKVWENILNIKTKNAV